MDVGISSGFVIADIPGLIEGAAQGTGLGIQFLKHLNRTRLLLHLVDIASPDGKDASEAIREVERELQAFDAALWNKPRWLVFNKIDTLGAELAQDVVSELVDQMGLSCPVFLISAATGEGCRDLVNRIMQTLDEMAEADRTRAENEASYE